MIRKIKMADSPVGPSSVILRFILGPQMMTPGREVTVDMTTNQAIGIEQSRDFEFVEIEKKLAKAKIKKKKGK